VGLNLKSLKKVHNHCARYASSGQGGGKPRRAPGTRRYVSKGEMQLLRFTILTLFISMPAICNGLESDDDRRHKQAELDYACEEARQIALAPRKLAVYQECIDKFKKEVEYCEKQADDYNGTRVNGSPLFYDLPECEVAFENRSKYRKAD